ncbi:MAG TPA: hypothetical protein VKY39_05630 [Aggregatilineales bacterium]|jgi:hypothetical protein|nr:hypothetical protein [Aggregatilineales bacterium]
MAQQNPNEEVPLELLAETESFAVLVGEDDDGERIYNVELGGVTLHLFREEWNELVQLVKEAARNS